MNERVMQFRIGMFVIVAGLVLTMLIVWFGESPSLFRDHAYVVVHFIEAPGVAEGIPVRKSGIRVGEVASIRFDDRERHEGTVSGLDASGRIDVDLAGGRHGFVPADQFPGDLPAIGATLHVMINGPSGEPGLLALSLPDGVLVTISLEKKYKIRSGATPRVSRALIGDVSIDLLPGEGQGPLTLSDDPSKAPVIEGLVAPDPSNALAAATKAFEKVGGTLESIDSAAKGLAVVAGKAENLDQFLASWSKMGDSVRTLADHTDQLIRENEAQLTPAITHFRQTMEKINTTLDEPTQENLRRTADRLASGSARLDAVLADIQPLAQDLGARPGASPSTGFGKLVANLNWVAYDVGLLTRTLRGPDGQLNRNGSVQKLLTESTLYDNLNAMASGGRDVFTSAKPVMRNFGRFAERIAADPSAISRGALRGP